jgi:riboflavin synthase
MQRRLSECNRSPGRKETHRRDKAGGAEKTIDPVNSVVVREKPMFTGIVEGRGRIRSIEPHAEFVRLVITTDMDLDDVRVGDSICVDGACLTATTVGRGSSDFSADVSPETLGVTTLGKLRPGSCVNLEKALRFDSRLGGHLVSGHVDCIGSVIEKRSAGRGFLMGFSVDSSRYLVEKGSVAVDGVSLTVNEVAQDRFRVMIIPHTSGLTGLTDKTIGDRVNIEFDIIGKYVEKFVGTRAGEPRIDLNKLKEYGFL